MNRFHRWFCATDRWAKAVQKDLVPWVMDGIDLGPNALEVGPGPGRVTETLRHSVERLTSIEIDAGLARSLATRLGGSNVSVVHGDATEMPFENETFQSAVCLTMLHHVPSPFLQDKLLAEVHRVLRPGGVFVGSDSRWSLPFQLIHLFDTMIVIDPDFFGRRLERAGFTEVSVEKVRTAFRFRARRPAA